MHAAASFNQFANHETATLPSALESQRPPAPFPSNSYPVTSRSGQFCLRVARGARVAADRVTIDESRLFCEFVDTRATT